MNTYPTPLQRWHCCGFLPPCPWPGDLVLTKPGDFNGSEDRARGADLVSLVLDPLASKLKKHCQCCFDE